MPSDKGSMRLYFTLSMVLQDGAAHKAIWMRRQDVGSKPCMLCASKGISGDETEEKSGLSFASKASSSPLAMQKLLILGAEWLRDSMCFHRWSSTSGSRPQGYLSVHMTFCQAVLCRVMVYCFLPAGIAMTICTQCAQMASWLTQFIWSWRLFSVLGTMHGACWANGCLYGFFQKTSKALTFPSSLMHKSDQVQKGQGLQVFSFRNADALQASSVLFGGHVHEQQLHGQGV